ncbi:MAG: subclass B3 metallo-beta-lactamase [Proteobacteria bacterium]|nr:subclass B3 metallo-beta-lactamase [Pseudomonadota bacterium]
MARPALWLMIFMFIARSAIAADTPPEWTAPQAPLRLADNLYYVGSQDLAAYLVTGSAGHILINANLEQSPAQIRASVEALGFTWRDIRIVLNSQAHADHVAGIARVLAETGARDLVMVGDAEAIRTGGRSDFAHLSDALPLFPAARVDQELRDGEVVKLGDLELTAHRTAGHTRGCTTWTLSVHLPGEAADVHHLAVIVGGVSVLPHYRLLDTPGRHASYPQIAQDYRATFQALRALPCEIFLGAHGVYFGLAAKAARSASAGPSAFIDPQGYRDFVEAAARDFERIYARQAAEKKGAAVEM